MYATRVSLALWFTLAGCGLTLEAGGGGSSSGDPGTSSGGSDETTSSSSSSGDATTSSGGSSSGMPDANVSSSSSSSSGMPPTDASTTDANTDAPVVHVPSVSALTLLAPDDRTSGADGPITSNDVDDQGFEIRVKGSVHGLILVELDNDDEPTNVHWDTYVGADPIPEGFAHTEGRTTYQLGAFDSGGGLLNDATGRLMLPDGDRVLHIYVNHVGYFQTGGRYRAVLEADDGTLAKSPIYTVP